jgi:membrane protein insertase Oxa1/YidC/SpoIIIJ
MDCFFGDPINLSGSTSTPNFAYSTLTCPDATGTPILIQNPETGASFYLSPVISYGDFFIFILASAILTFWIVSKIASFLKRFFAHV